MKPTENEIPRSTRRPWKTLVFLLRRVHLYLGLFLFPWAILYGVTAFLFNHPTAFSDQPTMSFESNEIEGTPLADRPTVQEHAEAFVEKLNATQKPGVPYRVAGEAKYNREFAFATVKQETQTIGVLFDVNHGNGTIRVTPPAEKKEAPKAPFATGAGVKQKRNAVASPTPNSELVLDRPLHERFRDSLGEVLARLGYPYAGEVTVTSVPEIVVPMEADGRIWLATYNPMTGAVSGVPADDVEKPELSVRRFLTRLHVTHGYPSDTAKASWFWALIVDAMAFTLLFWGCTGLLMWWQIKATRLTGAVVLILSALAATALGFAMHRALTT